MSKAFVELGFVPQPLGEMRSRAASFRATMERRRNVRDFSTRAVPRAIIVDALRAATHAPSGRNLQPWTFVAISNPALKRRIRLAAEEVTGQLVRSRGPRISKSMSAMGAEAEKPYFEAAPWLIVVFSRPSPLPRSFVTESVGIATGILVAGLQDMGLATFVHRPEPKYFLNEMCRRPDSERPFVLVATGFPAKHCLVPVLDRRGFSEMMVFLE